MAFKLNLSFNARWNHKHKCIPNQKKKKKEEEEEEEDDDSV